MTFLLDSTIKVSVILLIALTAMGLMRRQSAAFRHWVLAAAIFCAAVMPWLGIVVPAWELNLKALLPVESSAPIEELSARSTDGSNETVKGTPDSGLSPVPFRFFGFVWGVGFLVSLTMLVSGLGRLTWLASSSGPIQDRKWLRLVEEVARAYGLSRRVQVLQSHHPAMLVTWGVLRPKILLPVGASDWEEERVRFVLCHELAHVRRNDWFVQMVAELLRAVYWFNPLLWIACGRLRQVGEHACDDAVLKFGGVRSEYAAHLLALARTLNISERPWSSAVAMARSSTLERRFRAMLNTRLSHDAISRPLCILTLTVYVVRVIRTEEPIC